MLIKKILIGIDDTKFSENAAQYGFDIAHKFKAEVGMVHIVEPIVIPPNNAADPLLGASDLSMMPNAEVFEAQNKASESLVDRAVKKFAAGIQVTHFNEFGDTANGIIDCSKEFGADLIVIGTHNRSGIDRLLMGSVAEHVVRHSAVPVLVVPLKESES